MTQAISDNVGPARELVTPTLQQTVNRLDPETRLVVSYHFGWCDEHGCPANANSGKAIRPALALLGAEASGADPQTTLPGATAVELIHNFSLVHDNLMDRDRRCRHGAAAQTTVAALANRAPADHLQALAHYLADRNT